MKRFGLAVLVMLAGGCHYDSLLAVHYHAAQKPAASAPAAPPAASQPADPPDAGDLLWHYIPK